MKRASILLAIMLLMGAALVPSAWCYTNMDIVTEANTYADRPPSGVCDDNLFCKRFVQKVIGDLSAAHGGGITSPTLLAGYSEEIYSNSGALPISEEDATHGDIGQVSNSDNPGDETRVHTFFILENLGNGSYRVKDSNWHLDKCVDTHVMNARTFVDDYPEFSVNYHRIGAGVVGLRDNPSNPIIPDVSDAFNDGFHRAEAAGHSYFAKSFVHQVYGTYAQDLCEENVGVTGTCPTGKDAILMYNEDEWMDGDDGNAHLIKEGFWGLWKQMGELTAQMGHRENIGYPISSESEPGQDGRTFQHFEHGSFEWDPTEGRITATMNKNDNRYEFWWSGSNLCGTCTSGCSSDTRCLGSYLQQFTSTGGSISTTTVADHYLTGAAYTGPTYTPDVRDFLSGGRITRVFTMPDGSVYALANQIQAGSGFRDGVLYVSRDQGLTWESVAWGADAADPYPFEPGTVTVSKDDKLYLYRGKSEDFLGQFQGVVRTAFLSPTRLFWARDDITTAPVTRSEVGGQSRGGWGFGSRMWAGTDRGHDIVFCGSPNRSDFGYARSDTSTFVPRICSTDGIVDVEQSPADPDKLWVLDRTGNVWDISIRGKDWRRHSRVPFGYSRSYSQIIWPATSIAINPKNPNVIYVTHDGMSYHDPGLWRSDNGGSSWSLVMPLVWSMDCSVSPDGSIIYVASRDPGEGYGGIHIYEEPTVPLP